MLGAHTSPAKRHGSAAVIIRLGFLLSIILVLSFFFSSQSPYVYPEEISSPPTITGSEVKPYIENNFQEARWYALIETVEVEGEDIAIKTYIFPDQEGRRLAGEILKELNRKGISGNIKIYGRNVSYSLLTP